MVPSVLMPGLLWEEVETLWCGQMSVERLQESLYGRSLNQADCGGWTYYSGFMMAVLFAEENKEVCMEGRRSSAGRRTFVVSCRKCVKAEASSEDGRWEEAEADQKDARKTHLLPRGVV